ncbi:hypothetical protein FRC12_018126 [Ceratobasidium sp. 428]|nr:hypothetical protein FRC12_018126 [Ceratobasidium sp. 428]
MGHLLGGPNGVPLVVGSLLKAAHWANTFNIQDEHKDKLDAIFPAVVMSPALFPRLPAPELRGEFKSVEKTAYMRVNRSAARSCAYMQFFQRIRIRRVKPHLNLVRVPARHHYPADMITDYLKMSIIDYTTHVSVALAAISPSADACDSSAFSTPEFQGMIALSDSANAPPLVGSNPAPTGTLSSGTQEVQLKPAVHARAQNLASTSTKESAKVGFILKSIAAYSADGTLATDAWYPIEVPFVWQSCAARATAKRFNPSGCDKQAHSHQCVYVSAQTSCVEHVVDDDDDVVFIADRPQDKSFQAVSVSDTAPTSASPIPEVPKKRKRPPMCPSPNDPDSGTQRDSPAVSTHDGPS